MQPVLIAKNITKRFTHPAPLDILKGIDLTVHAKKSAAIVGKSGEGKTTLLHILGTIDDPTSGIVTICGTQVGIQIQKGLQDALRNQHIGFIFQAFHLLSDATVLENILMPAKIARRDTHKHSACYKRACELSEMVGLQERLHFSADQLSGGERQRVAIARAFINDPEIILADEPTGNLDHATAQDIQTLLLECTQKQNKALVVVTHNREFAKLLDDYYELEGGYLKHSE